ncbi:MAG: hypothetical protein QOD06_358 [Candidatus Binatota bacterium]|nr:hypothetical protein [Candidatus Binatota bacterium]
MISGTRFRRLAAAALLASTVEAAPAPTPTVPPAARGPTAEELRARTVAGLQAYFRGDFDAAAIALKRVTVATAPPPDVEILDYFLGRSFRELGLRGLALHYLGLVETAGKPRWRDLARVEIVRIYFESAEYASALEAFRRGKERAAGGEITYLGGISAALEGHWGEAEEILARVRPADPLYAYAVYARAQARAAADDLPAAARDLRELVGLDGKAPAALRDQARILLGKVLYLMGREREGRASFAAVEGAGVGVEVMQGLLLTGAGSDAASRVEIAAGRPADRAMSLLVSAVAADEHAKPGGEVAAREELRDLVREREKALADIRGGGETAVRLRRDLGGFSALLRRARWVTRAREELASLPASLAGDVDAKAPADPERFRPQEPTFYAVWSQARADVWLRGLIDLLSRAEDLGHDVQEAPDESFFHWFGWFGQGEDEVRVALGLLAMRQLNLEQGYLDHRHTFHGRSEDLSTEKRPAVTSTAALLDRLYVEDLRRTPKELVNYAKWVEYKRSDIMRLTAAVPERSTDPVVSLFGNYLDVLENLRRALDAKDVDVPSLGAAREPTLTALAKRNRDLGERLARELAQAMSGVLRAESVFFVRLEADNEGSLSRLYARRGGLPPRGKAAAEATAERKAP